MTPERAVKKKVRELFQAEKVHYITPATGGYGVSGAQDFIACVNGFFLGVECKAGGNELTALQKMAMHATWEAGGKSLVINEHNLPLLEKTIHQLKKRKWLT